PRSETWNFPNPDTATSLPRRSASSTVAIRASTARDASCLVKAARSATWSISSDFVTFALLSGWKPLLATLTPNADRRIGNNLRDVRRQSRLDRHRPRRADHRAAGAARRIHGLRRPRTGRRDRRGDQPGLGARGARPATAQPREQLARGPAAMTDRVLLRFGQ